MRYQTNRMRFWTALVLCVATGGGGGARAQVNSASTINWEPALSAAYTRAMEQDKPMVVYLYMVGSPWCEKLEQEVLFQPAFNAHAGKAVFARVDVDKDDAAQNVSKLMNDLGITSLPVVTVLRPGKDQIIETGQVAGYYEPAEFMPQFEKHLNACLAEIAANPAPRDTNELPQTPPATPPDDALDIDLTPWRDLMLVPGEEAPIGQCTIADMAVLNALRKLGYQPTTADLPNGAGCEVQVTVRRGERDYTVSLKHVYGEMVALIAPLGKTNGQNVEASTLLRVLRRNIDFFPAHVVFAEDEFDLLCPVEQRDLESAERFQPVLDKFVDVLADNAELWKELGGQ